jgi:lipoprotein-anchoring transpeptidase ErfK/SrfK
MAITIHKSPLSRPIMFLFMTAGGVMLLGGILGVRPSLSQLVQITPPRPIVPASPRAKDTKLIVNLADRQVRLYRNGKEMSRHTVAIGQAGWETPAGSFKIHQMKRDPEWQHPITKEVFPRGENNPLGDRWIGFYEGEHMAIGFHGTPDESAVGQAVSHGCLRMRNADIRAMFEQVGVGTIVEVVSESRR